jgi:hypothetical protein
MTADHFGFGPCRNGTERDWPCSQAAVNDSGLCRWHFKVARRIAAPWRPEPLEAPAKRKAGKR